MTIPASTGQAEQMPPPFTIFRMVTGYYVSSALYVAAKLQIADLLAEGKTSAEQLADAARVRTAPLRRMLRLLVSSGVFVENADGTFGLNALANCLRDSGSQSTRAMVLLFGGITQRAWSELLHAVQTGNPAFDKVFGQDSFTYMAQHPEEAADFDAAMADFTRMVAERVVAVYDFSRFKTVVDVGGGSGVLISVVLSANPGIRGILFDQPHVAARSLQRIRGMGLGPRCTVTGGDFFCEVPSGGDVYVLKHVIHDWDDDHARLILRNCHRAMQGQATLMLVEGVYPPYVDASAASQSAACDDVNMLVCTGGKQRSEQEFRCLLAESGFRLQRVIPTGARSFVIESERTS